MRPKARGPAQHGGPPGWLSKSDPASVILSVMDGPYRLPFPSMQYRLLRQELPSCELMLYCIVNVHNHPS